MKIKNTNNFNVCFTKDKKAFTLEANGEINISNEDYENIRNVQGIIKMKQRKGDE
jgi:hypothetical protein